MLPNVVPLEDEEVSVEVAKAFTKLGFKLMTNTRVESLTKTADGVEVKAGGQTVKADLALVAIGFAPNSEDIGWKRRASRLNAAGPLQRRRDPG